MAPLIERRPAELGRILLRKSVAELVAVGRGHAFATLPAPGAGLALDPSDRPAAPGRSSSEKDCARLGEPFGLPLVAVGRSTLP